MPPVMTSREPSQPPGTVPLEDLQRNYSGVAIILQPTPSRNPNDPLNWKQWEKLINYGLVLLYSLLMFIVIGAATPTWAPMNEQLGFSYEILNDSYATGSATLCIGALIFIPVALKFGRRPIYLLSALLQVAICIWFAKVQTIADLMLVNALSCLLGALAEVIVQMTVADMFFVHQRGQMNSLYIWVMIIGSALAPLVAGYITDSQGWRWVWWWMAILFGVCFVLFLFLYEETKFVEWIDGSPPSNTTKELNSTAQQRQGTGKEDYKDDLDIELAKVQSTTIHTCRPDLDLSILRTPYVRRLALWSTTPGSLGFFIRHIYQPLVVTVAFPAVFYVAVLYGVITATWQVMITVIASVMPETPYNFTASQIGLMSLAPLIGTTLGSLITGPLSDRLILWLAKRNGGLFEPEMRLWIVLAFAPLIPAGILLFGYSLGNGNSWIIVAAGYAIFGLAMAPVSSASLTYLTDAYTNIVADSLVGVTFVRNLLATIFVFAITPWEAAVGLQSVFLTLGVFMIAILGPGTLVFMYFGKQLRAKTAGRYRSYS
ncbi:major facilitator superfamily domain-containing protein [Penicillium frequentans]|nr:major facilitator superfamily domain-containing protein [Penicillium glabrum]